MKKTLIIGASPDSFRNSYKAVIALQRKKIEVVALGIRSGEIFDVKIDTDRLNYENIHTVSLYISADKQYDYYDYIFSLNPKRLIFNPGTYNSELAEKAKEKSIEIVEKCTMLLLSDEEF